jgi:phage baseplate assembly protein gpV
LLALSESVLQAIARHDTATLAACLSRQFVLLAPSGRQDRAAFLAGVGGATFEARSFGFDWIDVQIVDGAAVVAGVQRVDLVVDGKEVTSRAAFTDLFVIEDGGWRLAVAHSTDLAAE